MCVVQGALKDANIIPSSNEVSTSDFLQALTSKFGSAPILFCDEDRSGNRYIDSVRCLRLSSSASVSFSLFVGDWRALKVCQGWGA